MRADLSAPLVLATIAIALATGALTLAVARVRRRRRDRESHRRRLSADGHPPYAVPIPPSPARGTRAAEVMRLFGSLRPGSMIEGFRIAAIYDDDIGSVPVLFEGAEGARFRVDVLRRHAADPVPPAATERLALYLSGTSTGSATPEDFGRAMAALAMRLSEVDSPPPPWLLTMRERAEMLEKHRRPPG